MSNLTPNENTVLDFFLYRKSGKSFLAKHINEHFEFDYKEMLIDNLEEFLQEIKPKSITLDKTKRYTLKHLNAESWQRACCLYYLPELDKDSNQEPGWQFFLGFNPYISDRDINWDDLPEWMQTAFLNNPSLIVKDYKPGDDFED